jgi:uncharacterized protein (TIGR02453 family)
MKYFDPAFLDFFIELAANNHKEWFDANRKRYENVVKKPSEVFLTDLIAALQPDWPAGTAIRPRDCLFRINRDVRFSKDKTPYKMQVSAVISPYGKKDSRPALYVELGPSHLGIYGGVYFIEPDKLLRLRTHIAENIETFRALADAPDFVTTFGQLHGEQNKRLPGALNELAKSEPRLLNKQFYYFKELDPEIIITDELLPEILRYHEIGKPLNAFLAAGMEA